MIPSLKNLSDLKGKRVLLRLDLNVLVKDNEVAETFRIEQSLPTIRYLIEKEAKIIIISHIDKKEGGSLEPVARYLFKEFPRLRFLLDLNSAEAKAEVDNMLPGSLILFENLRNYEGEEKNDPEFARLLASFADIYVNEAFAVSHRHHASVEAITEFLPSYGGLLFESEISRLSEAFAPEHPFLFIIGGAKFETKIPLIEKFIPLADNIFVGGALANDFFKAKGYFVGDSVVSEHPLDLKKYLDEKKILIPEDVRTQHKGFRYLKDPTEISVNEKIWDIGEKAEKHLKELIKEAKFIVWNGPVGYFEGGSAGGTHFVAKTLAEASARVIVGGGDTLAVIHELNLISKYSFVSTGGGAMLDFLANGTLPGIEALKKHMTHAQEGGSWIKKIFSK